MALARMCRRRGSKALRSCPIEAPEGGDCLELCVAQILVYAAGGVEPKPEWKEAARVALDFKVNQCIIW